MLPTDEKDVPLLVENPLVAVRVEVEEYWLLVLIILFVGLNIGLRICQVCLEISLGLGGVVISGLFEMDFSGKEIGFFVVVELENEECRHARC